MTLTRLTRPSRLLALALLAPPLLAGELTLEATPFRVVHRFDATVLPVEPAVIQLDPESWENFQIESLVAHGETVKPGDPLFVFKAEALERRIEDQRSAAELARLEAASKKLTFDKRKEEVELELAAIRRAKDEADEDLEYFTEVGRPAAEKQVRLANEREAFSLQAEREELKQLKQMYEEDDLTEQTEEIILDRQKFLVERAEAELEETRRRGKKTLESSLPRQLKGLEAAAKAAAIALAKAEDELPRSLAKAEAEWDQARRGSERASEELERLEKDAGLLTIEAPVGGVFHHGVFEDGGWKLGDLAKHLVVCGSVPRRRPLAAVVAADTGRELGARLPSEVARSLEPEQKFAVTLGGREGLALVGTLESLAATPGGDGKHLATIEIEWPEELPVAAVAAGTPAQCVALVHEQPEALVVPDAALHPQADGSWSVRVKLADGQFESRAVEPGLLSGKKREILSGLEAGQVVIVPDSSD